MGRLLPLGAYATVEVDRPVGTRLVGPGGRQHKALSKALSSLRPSKRGDLRVKRRFVGAFVQMLNAVEARHPGAAEAFVEGVESCRDVQDRYLVAMGARTDDADGGARWVRPGAGDHRRVSDALLAAGMVTKALAASVFGGVDPSKVDAAVSRTGGVRRVEMTRAGRFRTDTDRRLRMRSDPTASPRLDDPCVFDRWYASLDHVGASDAIQRTFSTIGHTGGRCFSILGLDLYDVFVTGMKRRVLPVADKGDLTRARTLDKELPDEEWEKLFAYVGGERAERSGLSLEEIRLIAMDRRRREQLRGMPLFTEDGTSFIKYDRLYRVTRRAAVATGLFYGDVDAASGPRRYVNLHLLRHEYVHAKLVAIGRIGSEATRRGEIRRLIRYMGWSGRGMLEWYSMHHDIVGIGRAATEHNERIDRRLRGRVDADAGADFRRSFEALKQLVWQA